MRGRKQKEAFTEAFTAPDALVTPFVSGRCETCCLILPATDSVQQTLTGKLRGLTQGLAKGFAFGRKQGHKDILRDQSAPPGTEVEKVVPLGGALKVLWINMDASKSRRTNIVRMLDSLSYDHQRHPAANVASVKRLYMTGQLQTPGTKLFDLPTNHAQLWKYHARNEYTWTEAACLLSHLTLIQNAYEAGHEMVLVLEDDAVILDTFHQHWRTYVAMAPPNWGVLQLFTNNAAVVEHGLHLHEPWISWQPDHWGTLAYIINRKGMERILAATLSKRKWVLADEGVLVSDELVYLHGLTYTATFPMFDTSRSTSLIQSESVMDMDHYSKLLEIAKTREPPSGQPRIGCSVLVITNALLSTEEDAVAAYHTLELDVAALQQHVTTAKWAVTLVLAADELYEIVQQWELPGVSFDIVLRSTRYNKFEFVRKAIESMASVEKVLLKDFDQNIVGFPFATFLATVKDAVIAGAIRESVKESMLRNLAQPRRQWFQINEAVTWKKEQGVNSTYKTAQGVNVQFVEQYFALLDSSFATWYFPQVLLDSIVNQPSDWGPDLMWCGAATSWDPSRPPCVLVPLVTLHQDSRMIVEPDHNISLKRQLNVKPLDYFEQHFPSWFGYSLPYREAFGGPFWQNRPKHKSSKFNDDYGDGQREQDEEDHEDTEEGAVAANGKNSQAKIAKDLRATLRTLRKDLRREVLLNGMTDFTNSYEEQLHPLLQWESSKRGKSREMAKEPSEVKPKTKEPSDGWLDKFVKPHLSPTESALRAVEISKARRGAQRYLLYRLGDMVWSTRLQRRKSPWAKKKKLASDKNLHDIAYPFSLATAYMQCTTKGNDLDTLAHLVDRYNIEVKPDPDDLVVHLRIGDVLENSKFTVKQHLLKQRDTKMRLTYWPNKGRKPDYVKPMSVYQEAARKYKGKVKNIVLVAGGCYATDFEKSVDYVMAVKIFFESEGFRVQLRLGETPDDDFVFMARAGVSKTGVINFVEGGGRFSELITKLIKHRGKTSARFSIASCNLPCLDWNSMIRCSLANNSIGSNIGH
jgi:GR25 family glycosyltransferase involved in LPS biosynthesis